MNQNTVLAYSCLLFLLFNSCAKDRTNDFTYEVIKGQKHLEVTKANLINLYQLNKKELAHLLDGLSYKIQDKFITEGELGYVRNVDSVAEAFQQVNLIEQPNKILRITWVSLDKKDRFAKFKAGVAKNENDLMYKSGDTFILRQGKDQYMASIQEVVIGKVISILKMD